MGIDTLKPRDGRESAAERLEELISKGSIHVSEGDTYKFHGAEYKVSDADVRGGTQDPRNPKADGVFNTNNGVIAFMKDGKYYITPYTEWTQRTLATNGFERAYEMPVLFSNGEQFRDEKKQELWEEMRNSVKENA